MLELINEEYLYKILTCESQSQLKEHFGDKCFYSLLKTVNKKHQGLRISLFFQSILPAFTKGMVYPVYTWSILISALQLGFLSLSVITGGIGLIALGLGAFYFFAEHSELKKQTTKIKHTSQLLTLRILCAEEILRRHPEFMPKLALSQPVVKKVKQLPLIKKSVSTAVLLSAMLFESYYLGGYAIISGLSLMAASALTGPIGISITVLTILSISAFFAYQQYRHNNCIEQEKIFQKQQNQKLQQSLTLCEKIKLSQEIKEPSQEIKEPPQEIKEPLQEIKEPPQEIKKSPQEIKELLSSESSLTVKVANDNLQKKSSVFPASQTQESTLTSPTLKSKPICLYPHALFSNQQVSRSLPTKSSRINKFARNNNIEYDPAYQWQNPGF